MAVRSHHPDPSSSFSFAVLKEEVNVNGVENNL